MKPPSSDFAPNLRHALTRLGWNATQLGDEIRCPERRTRRIVAGHTRPALEDVLPIAKAVGVRPEHLAWMSATAFRMRYPSPTPRGTPT